MTQFDPFQEQKLQRLQGIIYLLPMVGIIPALWTLYRRQGDTEQRKISRLSVMLTLSWLIFYSLLWFGSGQGAEVASFRLLYANGLLTSGYIVACLVFMLRIWQGKSIK